MTPLPVCTVMDNPPEGVFEEDITDETIQVTHNVIGSSSDSEEEPQNNGYELLPQQESDLDPEDGVIMGVGDQGDMDITLSEEQNTTRNYSAAQILALGPAVAVNQKPDELKEVWANTCMTETQPMDPALAEQIKAAMADFKLPTSAVPAWARVVPEEEWKAQLVASIKARGLPGPTNLEKDCEELCAGWRNCSDVFKH